MDDISAENNAAIYKPSESDEVLKLEKQYSSLIHSCLPGYDDKSKDDRSTGDLCKDSNISHKFNKESSKFQNKLEANPFDYQLKSSREVKPKSEGKSAPRVSEKSKFSIGMSAAKSKESCKSLAKPQSTKNTRSQKFQFQPATTLPTPDIYNEKPRLSGNVTQGS